MSTVMSFVLDVCRPLLSALCTYMLLEGKKGEVLSVRADVFRIVYNNKIYALGCFSPYSQTDEQFFHRENFRRQIQMNRGVFFKW